jgi:hypothetical protein
MWLRQRSVQVTISVIYLGKFFITIYDTAKVTATVVTYLLFENTHITFVNEINTRIVVMASPKSSLCMYTSTNTPMNVLQLHTVTVTIYIA